MTSPTPVNMSEAVDVAEKIDKMIADLNVSNGTALVALLVEMNATLKDAPQNAPAVIDLLHKAMALAIRDMVERGYIVGVEIVRSYAYPVNAHKR